MQTKGESAAVQQSIRQVPSASHSSVKHCCHATD